MKSMKPRSIGKVSPDIPAGKPVKTIKKSIGKPAGLRVATVPKPIEIDWNVWHKPMMDSIKAVSLSEIMYLAGQHNICYPGPEREPITADSLYADIVNICEKLVELHLNHWVYHEDRPLEGVNIFRDDSGTLNAEVVLACYADVPPGINLDPRLVVMLYTSGKEGPWFSISFQMASQFFY